MSTESLDGAIASSAAAVAATASAEESKPAAEDSSASAEQLGAATVEEVAVAAAASAEQQSELASLSAVASALLKAWVRGDQRALEQLAAGHFHLRMPALGVDAQGLPAGTCVRVSVCVCVW